MRLMEMKMMMKVMMMMKMLMMTMTWALTATAAAQQGCDPVTQYEERGECCKMCGPGTSMTSYGKCLEPQCKECERGEYQDKYTQELKCRRQPFCDSNKNFQVSVHESKTKRLACTCKLGFHCSSEECMTCVPHKACKPGHGVLSEGNYTHDTVCHKCREGTFSNETSWDGVCKKWTPCENGYHIQQSGTDVSDSICEKTFRNREAVICVVVLAIVVLFAAPIVYFLCKGKRQDAKGKVKDCVESCLGGKKEPRRETNVLIGPPTDPNDDDSILPELPTSKQECFVRTPEENEDEPSQEMSNATEVVFSDNGNYVTQENGKAEILSRQESQTQTITD